MVYLNRRLGLARINNDIQYFVYAITNIYFKLSAGFKIYNIKKWSMMFYNSAS